MKKLILFLMLGIFLISFASATIQTLGTFAQEKDINLIQTCASCTFNNITSVISPTSQELIGNFKMTKTGSVYNFTLGGGNTTILGEYLINGIGDIDGVNTVWNYNLFVTPNGKQFTTGNAIVYLGFIIILLFTFFLTIYGASKVRWKHTKADEDKIITINHFRYVKVLLFAMAYFELMFLFGLSYKIFNEAGIEGFTQFFNFIYQLFLRLMFPLMVFLVIVIFIIWINNKKLSKRLKLGLEK